MEGLCDKEYTVKILEEISVLKELHGANVFEVRAFQNGARALETDARDLKSLIDSGELEKIKGVGKGSISRIVRELYQSGESEEHAKLRAPFPDSLFQLFDIPGLGPRKIKTLYEKLEIKSMAELELACRENRIAGLEGFGEKTQANFLKQIEHLKKTQGHYLLDDALMECEKIVAYLKKSPSAKEVTVAGSVRRSKEIVRDLDILVSTDEPARIHEAFTQYTEADDVSSHGDTKSSIILRAGMQCDLRTVTEEEYPYALLYFTGSKEHNVELRTIAKKKGLKVNEYGIFKGEKKIACRSEKEIYEALGFSYVPPEARENSGEIELASEQAFPKLVEGKDIKGVFHVHSTYSDGKASLEDMIREAERLEYEYVGISDHSQSAKYAGGLDAEKIKKQFKEIDSLQKKFKIRIFKGIESDIKNDGSLDYDEKTLRDFDFVIGSVHSGYQMKEKEMTERLRRVMENKYLTFLGHMTGRLLLGRKGYPLDMEFLFEKSVEYGVTIELNAQPRRLDPDWRMCHSARKKGVKFSIHPDAHSVQGLSNVKLGVGIARKAWLEKKHVMNTLPLAKMEQFLKARRV